MSRTISILFLLSFFIMACNQPQKGTTENKNSDTSAAAGPVVLPDAYLPSIPMEELQHMWNVCNQIDYIFYDLPISSSVDNSPSAQAHLRHISDTPVNHRLKDRCGKAIGRIFFKAEGDDLIDAEVYFSGGCAFYVFFKQGKAAYSNLMTPDGSNYYNQIIAAATGVKTPTGQ